MDTFKPMPNWPEFNKYEVLIDAYMQSLKFKETEIKKYLTKVILPQNI